MKRLNVKLLLILVITVALLSTGVAVVHAIQMNRNSDSLLKRAETAKTAGDTNQAIWYYRRYLSYKNKDLERYADYALLTASVAESPTATPQEYGIALKELQNVLLNDRSTRTDRLSDKSRAEVRRKLINLEMETRQLQLVAAARMLLLEMKAKSETTPEDEFKLAKCDTALAKYSDAAKVLETLVGYNTETKKFDSAKATLPHEVDAYLTLASLLREKISDTEMSNREDIANKTIEQLVKENKDSVKALLGQARYLQQYVSREKAKPIVDKALELAPQDADVLLEAIELTVQGNDYATAETLLKKGIELHPKDDRFYVRYAYLAKRQGKPELAKQRLEAGLLEDPTSMSLLEMLLETQLEQRDTKTAKITMQKLATTRYPPIWKEFREAQILLLDGDMLEVSKRLEKLRPQLGKASGLQRHEDFLLQTDYMLMQCYLALGFHDLALTTARRLAAENPNILEAQIGIGASLMALGKIDEARTEFERVLPVVEMSKNQAVLPQICNSLVQLRIAEQMRRPKEARDWDSVEGYISSLRQRGLANEPAVTLMQADVLMHKDDKKGARELLSKLAKQFPDNALILHARVESLLQDHLADEAIQLIEAAPKSLHNANLELARVDAIMQRTGNKADSLKELEALGARADKEMTSGTERSRVHIGVGIACIRLGDQVKALQQWKQAAAADSKNSKIHWMVFGLACDMHNLDVIQESLDWFQKEYGRDSSQAKLCEAAMAVVGVREAQIAAGHQLYELSDANKADLQKARDLLRTVENLRPDWYERFKVLAEIDVLENKPDEEIVDRKEALRLGPADPAQVKRIAQLLLLQKRYAEVKELLDTYGSESSQGLEKIEAISNQYNGRPDLALQRLESAIPKDSQNPGDHLYHGQLLASVGKMDEAEAELRRATELGPQQSENWLTLIYFLMSAHKADEARKAVQECQIHLPEDRRALAIAQGYEIVGDQQLADQFYKTALESAPNDIRTCRQVATYYLRNNRAELAEPLVNKLLNMKPTNFSDRDSIAWARRTTAQSLVAKGDYQSFQKAIEYLMPPPGEKSNAAELSLRASLLGSRPDAASAHQAISALLELKDLRALSPEERLLLAHMHERIGDWSSARDEMVSILAQPNAALPAYITMIEMLLRRGAMADAAVWAQKVEALRQVNPLLVATVQAHVAMAQDDGQQVVARMMRLVPTERPLPKDKVETLHLVADLLGQMNQYEQSEKLLREYVTYDPQKTIELASFLAKRGKVEEALQLAEQRRRTDPPVALLRVGTAAARQKIHPLTTEQIHQVEQWFQRATRDDPDSLAVQILWADFLDSQGRYDELEKVYRGILARTDVSAKDRAGISNNLAFALALQGHQLDDALKLSDETIAFLGPMPEALDTRGLIHLAKGDSKQAIRDLTDAVAVLDPQAVTYVHLAMAQAAAKDMSAARHSLDKAKDQRLDESDLSPLDRKKYDALVQQLKKPI